jgi:TonB family protein
MYKKPCLVLIFAAIISCFAQKATAQNASELNKPHTAADTIITFDPKTFEETKRVINTEYYTLVDEMPRLTTCAATQGDNTCTSSAMIAIIAKHLEYPAEMKAEGIKGLVMLEIPINADGSIDEMIFVARSTNNYFGNAARRAANFLQELKFVPGKIGGKPVNMRVQLPVRFVVTE